MRQKSSKRKYTKVCGNALLYYDRSEGKKMFFKFPAGKRSTLGELTIKIDVGRAGDHFRR